MRAKLFEVLLMLAREHFKKNNEALKKIVH